MYARWYTTLLLESFVLSINVAHACGSRPTRACQASSICQVMVRNPAWFENIWVSCEKDHFSLKTLYYPNINTGYNANLIESKFILVMTARNRKLINQKTEKYKTIAQNPARKKMWDKSFNPPLISSKLTWKTLWMRLGRLVTTNRTNWLLRWWSWPGIWSTLVFTLSVTCWNWRRRFLTYLTVCPT